MCTMSNRQPENTRKCIRLDADMLFFLKAVSASFFGNFRQTDMWFYNIFELLWQVLKVYRENWNAKLCVESFECCWFYFLDKMTGYTNYVNSAGKCTYSSSTNYIVPYMTLKTNRRKISSPERFFIHSCSMDKRKNPLLNDMKIKSFICQVQCIYIKGT